MLRLIDESTPRQAASANPDDYRSVGSVTRGETTLSLESDKGGMQAHYISRWVSTSERDGGGVGGDGGSGSVAADDRLGRV